MGTGTIVWLVLLWLLLSLLILMMLSWIKPADRTLTKWRWVRILMIIGGPVTILVIVAGVFLGAILGLLVLVPELLRDVLRN